MSQILFQEDDSDNYQSRTIKNASADVTLAFAIDFDTAGERLTKKSVLEQGKLYIPINLHLFNSSSSLIINEVEWAVNKIKTLNKKEISINIAGNGIYRLTDSFLRNQASVDYFIYHYLLLLNKPSNGLNIVQIRTGGQSGADEAGAKAGLKLGIETLVLAPKGWRFRDIQSNDISDEIRFKERFNIK